MEDTVDHYLREEYFFDGQVIKRVKSEGTSQRLFQSSKVILSESIYSDSSKALISEIPKKHYKIIMYPESSQISVYDTILLSMTVEEEAWIKCPYTHHNISNASWETIWDHLKILDLDLTPEYLSLPQYVPFLREQKFGPEKKLVKRVIKEGMGDNATVTSRITYDYEIILENGCIIEAVSGKTYTLSRNASPGVHLGMHLSLYTMRIYENALIRLSPGFHVSEKFLGQTVWGQIFIQNIDFSKDLVKPQYLEYLYEHILSIDNGIVKRIVKEGQGPTVENMSKIWIAMEGRLEDGYQFQKPKEEVVTLVGSKIYSEALVLGLGSMKKGEIAWIKAAPHTHLYKEGYENETLWLNLKVIEYLEFYQKLNSKMSIEEKLETSRNLLEIAKRLYSSGKKKDCRVFYNDIITTFKLKKDGYSELSDENKIQFIDVKGRSMMNLSLMLLKEAEESDKEDFKLKTLQKVFDMCNELLKYDENNVKGLYRRGCAYFIKRMYSDALIDFKKILSLDPKNRDAILYVKKIKKETDKTDKKERKVYKGIFTDSRWADESIKEEKQQEIKHEKAKEEEEVWKKEQEEIRLQREEQIRDYEKAFKELEKGTVIDTGDAANPLTELFLLDS